MRSSLNPEFKKSPSGIIGFDQITGGGLPYGRVTVLEGSSGTGKTVIALQMLVNGARDYNEPGIFVAFEEQSERIQSNAASFGWNLETYSQDQLYFLDAQPSADTVQSGSIDLDGMLAVLGALTDRMGARRIVFDALDIVLDLMPDPMEMRREIRRLHDWLLAREITAIITSKSMLHGRVVRTKSVDFLRFMVDSAISLRQEQVNGISQRSLRIIKYRGSSFEENDAPFVISKNGIELAGRFPLAQSWPVSNERVTTGIERLDAMLEGGYRRASSILITGAPGTAKTTLAGTFIEAACARGERSLFVSFDSREEEIIRDLRSVGIDLAAQVENGLLRLESAGGNNSSSEIHLMHIRQWVQEHEVRCLVIDPICSMGKSGNTLLAHNVIQRLADWAKQQNITLLATSLLDHTTPVAPPSQLMISTIADTWIHLDYCSVGGERNRGLSIVKSRGTAHSNQVREILLSSSGVTLADVYSSGGKVLMGTLRLERERSDAVTQQRAELVHRQYLGELEVEAAELEMREIAVQKSLQLKQEEIIDTRTLHKQIKESGTNTDIMIRRNRQMGNDRHDK